MSYSDLTMVIPIRIDSDDRFRNLNIVIDYLSKLPEIEVIVLEADSKPLLSGLPSEITNVFIKDDNPLFYRTKYLNILANMSHRKYLGVWDSDVIMDYAQISKALCLLRDDSADMVLPYDGRVINIRTPLLDDFIKDRNIALLISNISNIPPVYGNLSCGGAFVVNREAYIAAGGENEAFKSWGPEDLERYKRWEVKGYRVKRTDGVMFHLSHKVGENSKYFDLETKKNALKAVLKSCRGEF